MKTKNNRGLSRIERNIKCRDGKAGALLVTSNQGAQANGTTLIVEDMKEYLKIRYKGGVPAVQGKADCLAAKSYQSQMTLLCTAQRSRTAGASAGGDAAGAVRIRRLTPAECARLQTIPAWYKWNVSETQQYKMLGNGWTVEVIKHIFSFLPDELKK